MVQTWDFLLRLYAAGLAALSACGSASAPASAEAVSYTHLGVYPPGGHLDSVRDLAAAAGVNPNTMQRALAQLEAEGLVRTERTTGRFVTEDTALLEKLRDERSWLGLLEYNLSLIHI